MRQKLSARDIKKCQQHDGKKGGTSKCSAQNFKNFFQSLPIKKAVFAERANTAGTLYFPEVTPEVTPEENSDYFCFCSLAISERNSDNVPEGSFRPFALAACAQSRSNLVVRALTSRTKKLSALMTLTPFFCMFTKA